jgi:hypothetical protein
VEILAIVLTIALFLFLLAALVGIVNPRWVKQKSRIAAFFGNLGAAFLVLIALALVIPDAPDLPNAESSGVQQPKFDVAAPDDTVEQKELASIDTPEDTQGSDAARQTISEVPQFFFSADDFIRKYNNALHNLESGNADVFLKEENDNGEFLTITLGGPEHIALIVTANNQSRLVRDLLFLGSGDGTMQSGLNIVMGAVAMVMAIENSDMQVSERKQIVDALGLLNGKLSESGKVSFTRNGVDYQVSQSELTGTMITASPKD